MAPATSAASNRAISVWILGDQLLEDHPALTGCDPGDTRVVLVESRALLTRLPYHRKKLVLLLSAMRHYAEWLRSRGWSVDVIRADTMAEGLHRHWAAHRPGRVRTMAAADYAGRRWQTSRLPALADCPVEVLDNTQFLTGRFCPYPDPQPGKRYLLEHFYRAMRRHFSVLIDRDGQPEGGRWNFDADNRQRLPRAVRPPAPAAFPADDLTRQVMDEVAALPGLGTVDGFGYAVTTAEARQALGVFIRERLDQFGPYEDAMRADERTLFHSVLSPYLNLGLLTPLEAIQAAVSAFEQGQARLNSVEGFVRQILGWREYMYWQYWRLMPALAQANHWDARRPLPAWFWTGETDLACLHRVIGNSLVHGYAHHIERLMVLSNFSLLAGLDPQAVTDWFRSVYVDAYDWVMQSNAMGMGLNADGGQLATKPYIASANYIAKMSDHCDTCRYSPKQRTGPDACPFNTLYWNFLIEHEQALKANPRTGPAVLGVGRLTPRERSEIRAQARAWLDALEV